MNDILPEEVAQKVMQFNQMNILFLTTHANTGGITSYLLTLGQGLVKEGHKVLVVSSGGNCVSRFQDAGIRHVTINIRTKSEAHPKLLLAWPLLASFDP